MSSLSSELRASVSELRQRRCVRALGEVRWRQLARLCGWTVDDAEDACSAGRKQRGSFSSLLLLEAHNLSTMEFDGGSPGEEVALDHMPATRELEAGV